VRAVRAALIELELAGRIERSGGDRIALLTAHESD
jgi:predicted Rossmann fold nucleotide-binding protein DprA/Smf involved in DNA uptake